MTDRDNSALLLDLDGTLVDTAPDMVGTLQDLALEYALPKPPANSAAFVSDGSVGLLRLILDEDELTANRDTWVDRFLARYEERIAMASVLFPAFSKVLDECERRGIALGVVTNKPERLSRLLLDALDLSKRFSCLVGGDSLARRKPDPLPLLHAAEQLSCSAPNCLYVGDHRRDIDAAIAAKMPAVAAAWGYINPGDDPATWGADHVIESPASLLDLLPHDAPARPRHAI